MRTSIIALFTVVAAAATITVTAAPQMIARDLDAISGGNGNDILVRHVKKQCVPNGSFYDDASTKVPIEYRGAWTHLSNQGSTVKSGTLSYTSEANAMVILPDPFPAGTTVYADVTVWSTKKNDRGKFNIYIGETLIGTGDQYTSSGQETATQKVYYRQNVPIPGGSYFVIKNDKGAPFMAFDALELAFCY